MSSLAMRVNADPELATIPITSPEVQNRTGASPVLCVAFVAAPAGGYHVLPDRPGLRRHRRVDATPVGQATTHIEER